MIVRLRIGTSHELVSSLRHRIESEGLRTALSSEVARPILAIVDSASDTLVQELMARPEVEEVIRPRGE